MTPRLRLPHRHKALFLGLGVIALVVIGGAAAAVMLLSGAYSTAATKQHFPLTYRILELGLHYSVAAYADEIEVPDLQRHADIELGQACYRTYCVQCHGAPGISRDPLGQGQLPSPSALAQSAREWPASHLYYVIQKGIRMSGMPAWEFRISEHGLWSTVAFLKQLPRMTAATYRQMSNDLADKECPPPTGSPPYSVERAQTMLRQYACDNCHRIDDLVGPKTHIGPPLEDWSRRKLIAGRLPNTPDNLARWILDPQAVSPSTLMPNVGATESHARDMARYLFEAQ